MKCLKLLLIKWDESPYKTLSKYELYPFFYATNELKHLIEILELENKESGVVFFGRRFFVCNKDGLLEEYNVGNPQTKYMFVKFFTTYKYNKIKEMILREIIFFNNLAANESNLQETLNLYVGNLIEFRYPPVKKRISPDIILKNEIFIENFKMNGYVKKYGGSETGNNFVEENERGAIQKETGFSGYGSIFHNYTDALKITSGTNVVTKFLPSCNNDAIFIQNKPKNPTNTFQREDKHNPLDIRNRFIGKHTNPSFSPQNPVLSQNLPNTCLPNDPSDAIYIRKESHETRQRIYPFDLKELQDEHYSPHQSNFDSKFTAMLHNLWDELRNNHLNFPIPNTQMKFPTRSNSEFVRGVDVNHQNLSSNVANNQSIPSKPVLIPVHLSTLNQSHQNITDSHTHKYPICQQSCDPNKIRLENEESGHNVNNGVFYVPLSDIVQILLKYFPSNISNEPMHTSQ